MINDTILNELQIIFRDIFEDDKIVIKKNMSSNDFEKWDSLNHLLIIMQVEKIFGVKFTAEEVQNLKSINGIISKIDQKNLK